MSIAREITIYDLASELNISVATVSRGLKNDPVVKKKTRDRIHELAKQRGYRINHIARSLRSQKTYTIGVLVGKLASYFQACAISGIEKTANERGYHVIVSQSSEETLKEAENAETMFNHRVDGLLVSLAYNTSNLEHFESFFRQNIPVIFFDRVMDVGTTSSVVIDNQLAAYRATQHLIDQGCRNIVHVTAPMRQNVYRQRFEGYKAALTENELQFKEENIIICSLSFEAGMEAAERIKNMDTKPDGIFVSNDNCAVSCMIALQQQGFKIPEDICFVGFNNDPVSRVVAPKLTTIDYSGFEVGETAAELLFDTLSGLKSSKDHHQVVLNSELLIRPSSLR